MALEMAKELGLPLVEGLPNNAASLPHTITLAASYRLRINNLMELPKDKRPPRNLWDKPHRLNEYLDEVFEHDGDGPKSEKFIDFDLEEVE